jgi:hypothetical protein
MQTIFASTLIMVGAVVMAASIVRSKDLLKFAPFISEPSRAPTVRFLKIHRLLMSFFLLGYIVVAVSLLFDFHLLGELFVGVIFMLGAAFVLMGILIQSRMLFEIQSTIQVILPICSKCRKIRSSESDPNDRDSWLPVEVYISERTDADFTQGICPDCMDELYGVPKELRP